MHTCRCGTATCSSDLPGRVATASMRTEQNDVHNAGIGGFSMLAEQDQSVEGLEMECTALKKACVACQDEVGPLCPATARPRRTRGKRRGLGCGGNKDHGRKRGGGLFGPVNQRGGGLWVHNLLVGLLLVMVCGLGGVEGFAKLPNGDGTNSATGTTGTLRRAVSDWIDAGGASSSTVVATYGPIEDWDVSEVTNMKKVFYNFGSFNADLSKWNTGAVTTMYKSKCTRSLFPLSVACGHILPL